MTHREPGSGGRPWRRSLYAAAACALLGVAVHLSGQALPVQLAMVGLGVGVVGAGFLLAWAADAGDEVFSGGPVLAAIALVTVLPEFIIEIRFAYVQAAELVTANLTGATRLLLTGAMALPSLMVLAAPRRGGTSAPLNLGHHRRLELGILLVVSVFALQITVRGSLSVVDGVVLVSLYVLYIWRVQGVADERSAVAGVAAGLLSLPGRRQRPAVVGLIAVGGAVILLIANPFADAVLATGASLGVDPYHLIQSVVPVATEAPEFVVVAVLVAHHRPAQGLALFLASSVSQWSLGLGLLPMAYLMGGGGLAMPLAPREQLELAFTIALTLFVVAALATLRPTRADAYLIIGTFAVQLVHPAPVVRIVATFVLLVFAIDLGWSRRRELPGLLRAVFGRTRPSTRLPVDR